MKVIKTPKELAKLKPLRTLFMFPNGNGQLRPYDFSALPQDHKFLVKYNKRTRIIEVLFDVTLRFGDDASNVKCYKAPFDWDDSFEKEVEVPE